VDNDNLFHDKRIDSVLTVGEFYELSSGAEIILHN